MEDLIVYGVGALAVRGARHMLFGPSREARLAQQVQQLSSQVADQARMIQQLQTQALAPHPQHTNTSLDQQPVPDASRSENHQHSDDGALALRGQGTRSSKRSGGPIREASRSAKRVRHAAPVHASDSEGDDSDWSRDASKAQTDSSPPERSMSPSPEKGSDSPSDSSPPERSLSPLPPRRDELSTSEESSSSESDRDAASKRSLSQELLKGSPDSSDSRSEDSGSLDSEEEPPAVPQLPMPSSDADTSESESSSEEESLPAAPDSDSNSEATSSESNGASSSESEDSLPARSDPAVHGTTSQSPGSESGDLASSAHDGPEHPATSSSCDVSPSECETFSSDSEDGGSSERSQDAASDGSPEEASSQQPHPDSEVSHGMEASKEPAGGSEDASKDSSRNLPGPSEAGQRSTSTGSRPWQQCSGSGEGLSVDKASQADQPASALPEASYEMVTSRPCAFMPHIHEAEDPLSEEPTSFLGRPHATSSEGGADEQGPVVAQASQSEQEDGGSASQHAAARTKRGRDTTEEAPKSPEPKWRRSVFQRCSEALSGWLFASIPGTACSAAAAPTAPVPDASDDQEAVAETGTAEGVPWPMQPSLSMQTQPDEEESPAEGGQEAPAAVQNSEWAVSEELAAPVAAPEAQHAAGPIARGVFAEEEFSMDDAFLTELERLFTSDDRLRVDDPAPGPAPGGSTAAESPTLHEGPLMKLLRQLDEDIESHQAVAGTGEAAGPLRAPRKHPDLLEAGSSPAMAAQAPIGHSTDAPQTAGWDTGVDMASQPASPRADSATEKAASGQPHSCAETGSDAENLPQGHAAKDTRERSPSPGRPAVAADSDGWHDTPHWITEEVNARTSSPSPSGGTLHASLRFYTAPTSFSPSPSLFGYSPQYLSRPRLSPPRYGFEALGTGCLAPVSPSYRDPGSPPAVNFIGPAYQPRSIPGLGYRIERLERSPRQACSSLPHSDRRRSLQSRSPSPSPRWHSPSPARRCGRSRDRMRSASVSRSPRRGRSHSPSSSDGRSSFSRSSPEDSPPAATPSHLMSHEHSRSLSRSVSPRNPGSCVQYSTPDSPRAATPSYLMMCGRSGSATLSDRSPTSGYIDRRIRLRRSSLSARTITPDVPELADEAAQERSRMHARHRRSAGRQHDSRSPSRISPLSSQDCSPTHSAQEEELSAMFGGMPLHPVPGSRATRSPSPAREYHSPAGCSESRSPTPGFTPAFSAPGSPAAASPEPGYRGRHSSPTYRAQWSPFDVADPYSSKTHPQLYPADYSPELLYSSLPSLQDLYADGPSAGSPAQPQFPTDTRDEAEQSPGHSADSVSEELGLEQPARLLSSQHSPAVSARSRESRPPSRVTHAGEGNSGPSAAAPARLSPGISTPPTRGKRAAARSHHSARTGTSPSVLPPSVLPSPARERHSDGRSQSPASTGSPNPRTPPTRGACVAERDSATPDTIIERARSPPFHRSPTPAPQPGPSADFWRKHRAAARASLGSLLVVGHQPESPAFLVDAQPHESQLTEDDSACKEENNQTAIHAPSPPRELPGLPVALTSSPHEVTDEAHSQSTPPTAPSQPVRRPVSPLQNLGASRRLQMHLGSSWDARRSTFSSMSMRPGPAPGHLPYFWPRAVQGPSNADAHDGEAGEKPQEDVDVPCRPAWQRLGSRSMRGGGCSSGSGALRPGEAQAERSNSPPAAQAQREPEPEHSHSGGGCRSSGSHAVSCGQHMSSHTNSHGHSKFCRRKRCGPGRRALGAIMRTQRRFIGGWRHSRHRSGSAISAALASAADGADAATQPAPRQEALQTSRAADASPQLRAPLGRAHGVLLPRSASPELDRSVWDPAIWEKADLPWQRAAALQEELDARRAAADPLNALLAAACGAEGTTPANRPAPSAMGLKTSCPVARGSGSQSNGLPQDHNIPQQDSLIDLTLSDSDTPSCL